MRRPRLAILAGVFAGCNPAGAADGVPVLAGEPAVAAPTCSFTEWSARTLTSAMSGAAVKARLDRYQELAGNVESFMSMLHAVSVAKSVGNGLKGVAREAGRVLDWSGNKVVGVGVYIRSAGASTALAGVRILGSGECVQDILLDNYEKGITASSLALDVPTDWNIDYTQSYYAEIRRAADGTLTTSIIFPGSMEPYNAWVPYQSEAFKAMKLSTYARRAGQLVAISNRAAQNVVDTALKLKMEQTRQELIELTAKRQKVAEVLARQLREAKRARDASAWIGYMKDGLSFALVLQQVSTAIEETAPKSVKDEVASSNANTLPKIISQYTKSSTEQTSTRQGEYEMVDTEVRTRERTILYWGKQYGAPQGALDLPASPEAPKALP